MTTRTTRLVLFAIVGLVISAAPGWAAPQGTAAEIKDILVTDAADAASIELVIDTTAPIGEIVPLVYPGRKQVSFRVPGAYANPPKRYLNKVDNPIVKQIAMFPMNSRTMVVKTQLADGYKPEKARITTEVKDGHVYLRLWRVDPPLAVPAAPPAAAAEPSGTVASVETPEVLDPPIDLSKIFAESPTETEPDRAASAAPGETASQTNEDSPVALATSSAPELGMSLAKMVSALAATLALIVLLAAAYRRFGRRFVPRGLAADKPVRLVGSVAVGVKQKIDLVEVAGELLVLGVSEGQISLLTKIDARVGAEAAIAAAAKEAAAPKPAPVAAPSPPDLSVGIEVAAGDSAPGAFSARFAKEIRRLRDAGANGSSNGSSNGASSMPATLQAIRERVAAMKRL